MQKTCELEEDSETRKYTLISSHFFESQRGGNASVVLVVAAAAAAHGHVAVQTRPPADVAPPRVADGALLDDVIGVVVAAVSRVDADVAATAAAEVVVGLVDAATAAAGREIARLEDFRRRRRGGMLLWRENVG